MMVRATIAAAALAIVAQPQRAAPDFQFHNNFWVNLHGVVRAEARRRAVREPPAVKLETMSERERDAWSAALDGYADLAQRPVFDDAFVAIGNTLTMMSGDEPSLSGRGLDAGIARALTTAAPIYREHYWSAQRQLNDRWIAALAPTVAERGAAMADALGRLYRVAWPRDPIVVDASAEAGPVGGYTTDGPIGTAAHTVIEAANPEYQGDMAFEMLFHEASHAAAIAGPMIKALQAEAARQQVALPRDLWHVVLFYTAGELARRELGKSGDERYQPYAFRYGVYTRGWQPLRDAVVSDWQPYLDGRTTFDAAIAALIRDVRQ